MDKREPVYPVAADGTSCAVSRKRYENIRTGENVLCAWN